MTEFKLFTLAEPERTLPAGSAVQEPHRRSQSSLAAELLAGGARAELGARPASCSPLARTSPARRASISPGAGDGCVFKGFEKQG